LARPISAKPRRQLFREFPPALVLEKQVDQGKRAQRKVVAVAFELGSLKNGQIGELKETPSLSAGA
jgi:hypothetical protein